MDPNIMKLLEEDEDETMHSGADVDAFTAELNRDIEGNISTSQQPSESSGLAQENSQNSDHFLPQWQMPGHEGTVNLQSGQEPMGTEETEQHSSQMELQQRGSELERKDHEVPAHELNPLQHNLSVESETQLQVNQNVFDVSQPGDTQTYGEQPIQIQQSNRENNPEIKSHKQEEQNINNNNQFSAMVPNNSQPVSVESSGEQPLSPGIGNKNTTSIGTSTMNQHSMEMGTSSQQAMTSGMATQQPMTGSSQQSGGALKLNKQVPFGMLLPIIQPQLDKDRAMQLHTLYFKLKKNEITKDGFIRHMRSIVGDQMLKMAVYKLQTQVPRPAQAAPGQLQSLPHASGRQMQAVADSSNSIDDGNSAKSHEVETLATAQGQANQLSAPSPGALAQDRKHPAFPAQGLNKQQNMHLPQSSFPALASGGSSYPPFSSNNVQSSASIRHHPLDSQMKQSNHLGPSNQAMNTMNMPNKIQPGGPTHPNSNSALQRDQVPWAPSGHVKPEPFDHSNEQQRTQFSSPRGLSSGPVRPANVGPGKFRDETFDLQPSRTGLTSPSGLVPTNSASSPISSQIETNILSHNRMSSLTSPIGSGNISKPAPPKKPVIGQKKPMEPPGSSPPSKKQKTSGALSDQSIEHLNDVTAVSGVDLREEEEQLFSGPKEGSRVSEASRRVVQEEEERLILNKGPLQKMLVETMAKYGLKNVGSDVERCLSLSVEERLRGLIFNLIRMSKQRVDIEKSRHKCIVTSDIREQIRSINNKAREEWEKKQAETEKSQDPNEPEDTNGVDDKEKDESRAKLTKANKEEDDKMRATAANVAVRAATGVSDMLSRWQLMVEAKQKQGGSDASSSVTSQPGKDLTKKASLTSTRNTRENHDAEKRDSLATSTTTASVRKTARNQVVVPRVARTISTKDVLAVLEREPQMSKSALLYRLYNQTTSTDDENTSK